MYINPAPGVPRARRIARGGFRDLSVGWQYACGLTLSGRLHLQAGWQEARLLPEARRNQALLCALLIAGAALRIVRFMEHRPLWIDEAMLALNVGSRSVLELFSPLDYNQVAPALYLVALKLSAATFGMHEWVLRAPALIAAFALLWVVWLVARRVMPESGALAAVALAATSPMLIGYSAEAKPYELDALVTAVLVLLALRVIEHNTRGRRVMIGFAGILAPGFSLPASFVLAGLGCALLIASLQRRDRSGATSAIAWGAAWLASIGAAHTFAASDALASTMNEFWVPVMVAVDEPGWAGRTLLAIRWSVLGGVDPRGRIPELIALLIGAGGVVLLFRRRGLAVASVLSLPIVMALIASAASLWPVFARLALFLAPFGMWWVGALFAELFGDASRRVVVKAVACAGLALVVVADLGRPISAPYEESRALIHELRPRLAGRPVFLLQSTIPAWVYYTTDWRNPDPARLAWYTQFGEGDNRRSRGGPVREDEPAHSLRSAAGLEIVARPTGVRSVAAIGALTSGPDPDWGIVEAKRLRAESGGAAWVLGTHVGKSTLDSLRAGIVAAGGVITRERGAPGAVAWEVQFRSP